MVFFTSPGQEVDELRLRRSSSVASVRSRSRRSSGPRRASSQPRVSTHSHSPPRTEASNDVPTTRHDPSAASSSPSHMAALDAREHCMSLKSLPTSPPSQPPDDRSPSSSGPAPNLGQRHPGITSSSTSSLRPKIYFDTGSVSDSGIVSRTSRPSQYLDISLPGNKLHLSPLDTRHPSSSISQAGYLSEGNAFDRSSILLHPSRLDVKRLLSKPAAPSIASTLSITSDSECHATPRAQPNPTEVWPSKSRIQDHVNLCTGSPIVPIPEPSDRSPAQSPPPSPQQRPRSLFRKKSASGRVHATTSAATPPRRTSSMSYPLRSIVSPSGAPSRSQRSTVLQSVLGNRSSGSASAASRGSVRLTPAGAIAQAYKEQDIRREAFTAAARAETALPIIPTSSWSITTRTAEEDTSFRTTPGGSISCIGAMGIGKDILGGDHSRSSGSQPVKSLTRKVSAHFRRGLSTISGTGTGDVGGEGEQKNNLRNNFKGGNPSNRHERQRSSYAQRPKRKPESLRLSMDQPRGSADQRSGHPVLTESAEDSASLLVQGKGKDRAQEKEDTSTGGKLWKLVKRISGAGLRERFQPLGGPAPPVPAIPKELLPAVSPFTFEWPAPAPDGAGGHRGAEADCEKGHLMDSSLPKNGVSLSNDNHPFIATGTPPVSTHVHDANSHPNDPSTSSSPQSSGPASTQFFSSSHTPRSSFSSIMGTTSPPLQPASVPPRARSPTLSAVRRSIVAPSPERVDAPPPRPPRNRPYPYTTAAAKQQPGGVVDPMLAPGLSAAAAAESRNSHSSGGSTVRASSASPHTMSPSGTPTGSGPGARVTFREFGSSGQQAWTSQEKEDRWDDLLERSARAGGTLHLGAGSARLASDNIRFSTSTLASELSIRYPIYESVYPELSVNADISPNSETLKAMNFLRETTSTSSKHKANV
ncbi:hypothetical protein BGW80DRAFT_1250662 [Lactifluus volemus]|nr:hypothetical protein BGW80DRAFT_1250662 [Lactifluus volemus]